MSARIVGGVTVTVKGFKQAVGGGVTGIEEIITGGGGGGVVTGFVEIITGGGGGVAAALNTVIGKLHFPSSPSRGVIAFSTWNPTFGYVPSGTTELTPTTIGTVTLAPAAMVRRPTLGIQIKGLTN